MASSSTNNQNNQSNQSSDTSDKSKEVISTSTTGVEEIRNERVFRTRTCQAETDQQNDLSPHLIHKRSLAPLTSPLVSLSRASKQSLVREKRELVNPARPFEEILIDKSESDGSSGGTKPNKTA